MSYFLNPVEEDRCVFLSYEGEMPPVEVSAARYEANGEMGQRRWNRMVVDITQLESTPSPAQLQDFASALSSDSPKGARVALVVRPEQVRSVRLVEQVARSKGVFLAHFLDPDTATGWVKQIACPGQTINRNGKEKL